MSHEKLLKSEAATHAEIAGVFTARFAAPEGPLLLLAVAVVDHDPRVEGAAGPDEVGQHLVHAGQVRQHVVHVQFHPRAGVRRLEGERRQRRRLWLRGRARLGGCRHLLLLLLLLLLRRCCFRRLRLGSRVLLLLRSSGRPGWR